jgi:serine/threonine protein kinase
MVKLTRTTTPIALAPNTGVKRSAVAPVTCTASTSSHSSDHDDNDYVMDHRFCESLVSRTERKVQAFLAQSQWLRTHSCLDQIPRFDSTEFVLGKVIAEGGFSNIHEILSFRSATNPQETDPSQDNKFVVKHLKPDLALDPHGLKSAAKDICNEMHVLSALDHKHIVQIKGISSGGVNGFLSTGRADGFFLILPRLEQTLIHRIPHWRHKAMKQEGTLSLSKLGKSQSAWKLFQERIQTAQQLASALAYLHQHRILHRDIKPGNIAFDNEGCLKLIDFGLAMELPKSDDPNDTFELGNAGTVRYQAPEVIAKKPYNEKSESFSFAIVLWEMMALQKPYECLSCDEVKESVAQIGLRPAIHKSWPKALATLLRKCWSSRMTHRPSMPEIEVALEVLVHADYRKKTSVFAMFGF